MSWLSSLGDIAKTGFTWLSGNSIGSQLAKTALTGFILNQVAGNVNKGNDADKESGSRIQINPDPTASIPVVYGKAVVKGIITDAVLTNSNQTMWYCLVLSEKTGTKLSDSAVSSFTFKDIYWNNERLIFNSDGITVSKAVDNTGYENTEPAGLIRVYCFNGNSSTPVVPYNYTNASLSNATSLFPNWTVNHTMTDLIFVIIRMDYSSSKNVTGIGDWDFVIENSMTLPGDCLYDYMINTRYGAGIPSSEIYDV
jgi:hypothetical protein